MLDTTHERKISLNQISDLQGGVYGEKEKELINRENNYIYDDVLNDVDGIDFAQYFENFDFNKCKGEKRVAYSKIIKKDERK